MALIKITDTDYGVKASYWNIGGYMDHIREKRMDVTLYGYVNKDAYDAGSKPLCAAHITITTPVYQTCMPLKDIYEFIKTSNEFAGAQDV